MYELRIRQVPILVKVVENHYPGNVPTTDLALLTASQKPATRCSSELIRCLTGTLVLGLGLVDPVDRRVRLLSAEWTVLVWHSVLHSVVAYLD